MSFAGRIIIFLAGPVLATSVLADDPRWSIVQRQIDQKFPHVAKITTRELAALLADRRAEQPFLLDVRTQAEFEVSHLQGAHHVEPESDLTDVMLPARKSAPIVTYCAVGYRSAGFAEKLQTAGFTNVRNLDGSIFRWANENRPLVHDGKSAQTVHPYNAFWGGLVKKERRAAVPSIK